MAKIAVSKILTKGPDIKAFKLQDTGALRKAIDNTTQRQSEVLKLKDVDQDRLRMIVQL